MPCSDSCPGHGWRWVGRAWLGMYTVESEAWPLLGVVKFHLVNIAVQRYNIIGTLLYTIGLF